MAYYYKDGFYEETLHAGRIPEGAVKISNAQYHELISQEAAGGEIVAGANGHPEVRSRPGTSLEILRKKAEEAINADTDKKILTGFIYQGKRFYLSLENQLNFKAECDLRMSLSYPVKVKTYDDYLLIGNPSAYLDLYTAACAFIREKIEAGWAKKDQLQTMSEAELRKVIDDRL